MRPVDGQIEDLLSEINLRAAKKERVLVTTLTKRMAEDLTDYLSGRGVKVKYCLLYTSKTVVAKK